jgi:hypothetical protein
MVLPAVQPLPKEITIGRAMCHCCRGGIDDVLPELPMQGRTRRRHMKLLEGDSSAQERLQLRGGMRVCHQALLKGGTSLQELDASIQAG